MEQQQIKVSFSVGTKLLISVVSILIIVILFLNISTIFLFREDKQAYIYQNQSTEALLTGKEFITISKHVLDTLRTSLVDIKPRQGVDSPKFTTLDALVRNQSEISSIAIYLSDTKNGTNKLITEASRADHLLNYHLDPVDYRLSNELMASILPQILLNSYAFVNFSNVGSIPILGVVLADLSLKDNLAGMPVAVALVSLKEIAHDVKSFRLTITNSNGGILYDSEPTALFGKYNLSEHPLFIAAVENAIANGALEYDYKGVHYLGSYVTPGLNLVILTQLEWQKAMKATYKLVEKFILLGTMAVGVAIIFAILFSKTLTAPIGQLYEATKEIGKGNFLVHLEEKGRDEISALSKSFNTMSQKIGELVQESVHKVQLENELQIASTVQQTLIPPESYEGKNFRIFSHYQSATQCGGDWWGFFGVGNKVAIMIADATGHGLPSALITASARSCFSVMHKLAQEDPEFSFSPSAMLSYANRVIFDASMGQMMMTFFIGVLDFEKKTLKYANAAHNPPWLFKKNGDQFILKSLTASGQRLGEGRDVPEWEEKSTEIAENDILFLYTDGLTEGRNGAGDQFGKKRVRNIVEANLNSGPQKVVQQLMLEFMNHNQGKPLDDDVTLAVAVVTSLATVGHVDG